MKLLVLGSSAGGGFPQWNCNCPNCDGLRRGTIIAKSRSQSSIAVTVDGMQWLLINASPDLAQQSRRFLQLQPARARRDTGIAAVLVVDAQIDHCLGLLLLREHTAPIQLYATAEVLQELSSSLPIIPLMQHFCGVSPQVIPLDGSDLRFSFLPDIAITPLPVCSLPPPFSPYRGAPRRGDNIAIMFENERTGKRLFYAPGLGVVDADVSAAIQQADVVLVDGTFWRDDEMIALGISSKTSRDLGHLPQSGHGGVIELLSALPASTRKILIHINNTNPILREDSDERRELRELGIEVAEDGMEIEL